ncbi:DNA primase [Bacillus piscicola]|uniref:DNA primase n=1 Tax=Bacillus piscicola TaxID=1632684 RepID=UPI001F097917|nr:DNA primase [Bacillus piscicola]
MANYIPEETIAEIRRSLDIVEVISEYVQLQKRGKHYTGLCPFHEEKTPSFSVSPDKQLYHCFGCGAGGNVITFIMEIEQLQFAEAVQRLAENKGLSVPDIPLSGTVKDSTHNRKKEAHQLASRFYHHLLMSTEQGRESFEYLLQRGFEKETIELFQLGFAPDHDGLLKELLVKRGFDLTDMEECGLLRRHEAAWELHDRFRNRVMFPIRDMRGYTVGFGGRVLGTGEPKYLNSPETSIFNKSDTLYGMDLAKKEIRKQNTAVLFEGYMDVISAYQANVKNGVASLGTSLTERQAQVLSRNAERIIICFDGDNAGQEAAVKSANMLEKHGLNVQVAVLPERMDPDDYIHSKGAEQFKKEIIEAAIPFMAFKMETLKKNKNLHIEGDKLSYIEEVLKQITTLSKAVERDFYMRRLADEFSLSFDALKQEQYRIYKETRRSFDKVGKPRFNQVQRERRGTAPFVNKRILPAFQNAERFLLAHMMQSKEITAEVGERLGGGFNVDEHIALAAYLYSYYGDNNPADPGAFINQLDDANLVKKASEIAMLDISRHLSENELVDYIHQIKNYPKWVEIEEKEQKMKEAEKKSDLKQALQLAAEIVDMKKALKK